MSVPTNQSRRAFLGMRGQSSVACSAMRPPWTSVQSIAEHCTRCGDCIAACPEQILIAMPDGSPAVDFNRGACTFCGACADHCAAAVFQRDQSPPWHVTAAISDRCLASRGILCESCRDSCMDGAIRFVRALGHVPLPQIMAERCTGCGACVSVCPESAISATPAAVTAHG